MRTLLKGHWSPYVPYSPSPKQIAFCCLPHVEALYGGAAGSGKSSVLLMDALRFCDVPGYAAIIFRRNLTDLKRNGGLLDMAMQWLGPYIGRDLIYEPSTHMFKWFNGASLTFGYVGSYTAWEHYQGGNYQYCLEKSEKVRTKRGLVPVGKLKVGDQIHTLEGFQRVSHVFPPRKTECVRLSTKTGGSQIQSLDHRILTSKGWLSYLDCLSNFSTESHEFDSTDGFAKDSNLRSRLLAESLSSDQQQALVPSQQNHQESLHQDYASAQLGREIFAARSYGSLPGEMQLPELSVLAMLVEPDPHSSPSCLPNQDHPCESSCGPYDSLALNFQDHYRLDSYSCGEPTLDSSDNGLTYLPSQAYADATSPQHLQQDAQEDTPKHIPQSTSYTHPYTKEERSISVSCGFSPCRYSYVGVREVVDIRVETSNHYTSSHGLVNANCGFDELTQHSEQDYGEMFSRLRRNACSLHGDFPNEDCHICGMYSQLRTVPLRMRATTNPGGRGHLWVKKRFKLHKNKDAHFINPVTKLPGIWLSGDPTKPYIPGFFTDNPGLDQVSYEKNLRMINDKQRESQLLEGDWDWVANGLFRPEWFAHRYRYQGGYYALISPSGAGTHAFHEQKLRIFTVVDVACSVRTGVGERSFKQTQGAMLPASWTVIGTFGITPTNELLVLDVRRFQEEAPGIFDAMRDVCLKWKPMYVALEVNGPGKPIAQMAMQMGVAVKEVIAYGDKVSNAAEATVRARSGKIFFPEEDTQPWLQDAIGELVTWTGHPHETDDWADVLSNACHEYTRLSGNLDRQGVQILHRRDLPYVSKKHANIFDIPDALGF